MQVLCIFLFLSFKIYPLCFFIFKCLRIFNWDKSFIAVFLCSRWLFRVFHQLKWLSLIFCFLISIQNFVWMLSAFFMFILEDFIFLDQQEDLYADRSQAFGWLTSLLGFFFSLISSFKNQWCLLDRFSIFLISFLLNLFIF